MNEQDRRFLLDVITACHNSCNGSRVETPETAKPAIKLAEAATTALADEVRRVGLYGKAELATARRDLKAPAGQTASDPTSSEPNPQ